LAIISFFELIFLSDYDELRNAGALYFSNLLWNAWIQWGTHARPGKWPCLRQDKRLQDSTTGVGKLLTAGRMWPSYAQCTYLVFFCTDRVSKYGIKKHKKTCNKISSC